MATKSKKAIKISQKHLLGIQDLSVSDVNTILNEASKFIITIHKATNISGQIEGKKYKKIPAVIMARLLKTSVFADL